MKSASGSAAKRFALTVAVGAFGAIAVIAGQAYALDSLYSEIRFIDAKADGG